MATKRTLFSEEQQRLRAILQSAAISALMDSRRWQPGELAFQGGTCLHLAYGSARFSEDLDFMVRGGLSLEGLAKEVLRRIRLPPDIPADMTVVVSKGKDERNSHVFMITLGGPNVIGSAKVKIRLWQTRETALNSLKLVVSTITSPAGGQAFVPVLTLDEILADKVYALGARDRLKARDVFDLWWLCEQKPLVLNPDALCTRLDIYPDETGDRAHTAQRWITAAQKRLADLRAAQNVRAVAADLQRWLPSSWLMNDQVAIGMIESAAQKLQGGIQIMSERFGQAERMQGDQLASPQRDEGRARG